jgi:hypothetical protein
LKVEENKQHIKELRDIESGVKSVEKKIPAHLAGGSLEVPSVEYDD